MAQQKGIRHTRGYDDDFHKVAYGCVSIYIYMHTHRPGRSIQAKYTESNLKFQANCSLQWEEKYHRNGKVCGKWNKTKFLF